MEPDTPTTRPEVPGSTRLPAGSVDGVAAALASGMSGMLLVPLGFALLGGPGIAGAIIAAGVIGRLHAAGARPDDETATRMPDVADQSVPDANEPPPPPADATPIDEPPPAYATRMQRVPVHAPGSRTRREPQAAASRTPRPLRLVDPELRTGVWAALAAWLVVVALLLGAFGIFGSIDDLQRGATDAVGSAYDAYDRSCKDGMLADSKDLCDRIFQQRRDVMQAIDEQPLQLLATLLTFAVVPTALACHLLSVLIVRDRTLGRRRLPRPTEFEAHWSTVWAAGIGLLFMLVGSRIGGDPADVVSAIGACTSSIAFTLIAVQGFGVAAWFVLRPHTPLWYRLLVVVLAVLFLAGATLMCLVLGVLDQWLHIRQRASGNLGRRRADG